jgi:hypothetical protein
MKGHRSKRIVVFIMLMLMLGSLVGALASSTHIGSINSSLNQNDETGSSETPARDLAGSASTPVLYLSNITTLDSAAKHVAELANTSIIQAITSFLSSFDNRYTGTQGDLNAISYIQRFFEFNCSIQDSYLDNFTFNNGSTLIQASNIIARINASNPTPETLLITAHHDSIGYQFPLDVYSTGAEGADDDASGVAAVLETAQVLSMFRQDLRYNVLFVIFGAEEGNLTLDSAFMRQGSIHWFSSSHIGVGSLADIIGAVNLDSVAYQFGRAIGAFCQPSGENVVSNLSSSASMLDIALLNEGYARTGSYVKPVRATTEDTFNSFGVPGVTLSTDNPDPYTNTAQDTLSNLDFGLACNFTKTVLCYAYLVCGLTPEPTKTYGAGWSATLCLDARYSINETNYLDVLINPRTVMGYQLVVLDPSLGRISVSDLNSIVCACSANGRGIPIISLGGTGPELLQMLTQDEIESTVENSSSHALTGYIEDNLTSVVHHPVFSSPSNITLSLENDSILSYVIENVQPNGDVSSCYLVRDATQPDPSFLQLSYTPSASELWTWVGILDTHNSSRGPVAFIGAKDPSSLTNTARLIASNIAFWLLNGPTTSLIVESSENYPLVGDEVKVDACLRTTLTWEANSSVPIFLTVASPSGKQLLEETCVTDQDGIAESGNLFLAEIGQYRVNATISLPGQVYSSRIICFNSNARVDVSLANSQISVVQGESTDIRMNLTYVATTADNMTLALGGNCLSSNLSLPVAFRHGCMNMCLSVTAQESIPTGCYNLTLVIAPESKAFVACSQLIRMLIMPAYEVTIIQAPAAMVQGSRAQLLVQVRSLRTIEVSYDLRIDSTNIVVTGAVTSTISAGATQEIALPVEESSTSPYSWGEGEITAVLIRNGRTVASSQPSALSVSISPENLFTGYIFPPTLLIAITAHRFRKASVKRITIGTFLGGLSFFVFGCLISQSVFMVIPLAMLPLGSIAGTAATRYVYDKPLPKGYDWLFLSNAWEKNQSGRRTRKKADD